MPTPAQASVSLPGPLEIERRHLEAACERIRPHVHRTPVLSSRSLDEMAGAEVFFKCENFQRVGAFKARGAANAVFSLSKEERAKGVVTHSSGNHAAALALAARSAGTVAHIAMPRNAPAAKFKGTEAYGGKVYFCGNSALDRERAADRIAEETGAAFVHPSDDLRVILGQGTAAVELLEDFPDLDTVMAPVGGGGLIAGTALAVRFFGKPGATAVGGEPMAADDAYRSLLSGKIEHNETADTICDGLRTFLGESNFPIIRRDVESIVRVSEEEIVAAMRLLWERLKIIIEPSCAVPFAALLREKGRFAGKRVGVVLTGGNVDLDNLPF